MNRTPKISATEKDGWGDKLRAAERARENLYFAKIDEQLLARIRAEEAQAKATKRPETPELGDCPRCEEPLRSGSWRELDIEFCQKCGGLWLDPGDLLGLADSRGVGLHLTEVEQPQPKKA